MRNKQTREEYLAAARDRKDRFNARRAAQAMPPPCESAPLSPAMRDLARFDPIIANRLRRELGTPELGKDNWGRTLTA